jgi:hypothetical protein
LFAILGLLLCLIATRADEPPVIKDSEAAQYVGKNVEVRGLVVAVYTGKKGNTFLKFRRQISESDFHGLYCGGLGTGG